MKKDKENELELIIIRPKTEEVTDEDVKNFYKHLTCILLDDY